MANNETNSFESLVVKSKVVVPLEFFLFGLPGIKIDFKMPFNNGKNIEFSLNAPVKKVVGCKAL